MHADHTHSTGWLHGPRLWAVSALLGAGVGVLWAVLMPATMGSGGRPVVPLVLVVPFGLLLASVAVLPLVRPRWWHRHYPDVALFLGGVVCAYYLTALRASVGPSQVVHTAVEYLAFIALIGGLYVVSGGVRVSLGAPASPVANTLFLLLGAVLSNLVGTTGASMLLIRPFMEANQGRLRPLHVVFFIFIVSNCGGLLTPIGDPPLYLGFVKGVPFFWTFACLWRSWLLVVGVMLAVFFAFDAWTWRRAGRAMFGAWWPRVRVECSPWTMVVLVCMVGAVFIDPVLGRFVDLHHVPVGAMVQVMLAAVGYATARSGLREANDFSFEPVKEVGLLFAGIFLTMMPALAYLAVNGSRLGVATPSSFYFATGALSAVLDNAPTYLNFLQVSIAPADVSRAAIAGMLGTADGRLTLEAISCGAVFFGAMTYIGNGPNFMVRAIAERAGVRMPSFFTFAGLACLLLLPVLVLHWLVIIR
ncbi:MAG: sodium:proton antiporter [Phycisphaerales bacterium]